LNPPYRAGLCSAHCCSNSTFDSVTRPGFVSEEGQIVLEVLFFHPNWIDHVGEIVLRVGYNKCCVTHLVVPIWAHRRFLSRREICGNLGGFDCNTTPDQANKALIEVIE